MNRVHILRSCWQDMILIESNGLYALIDTGTYEAADQIMAYLDQVGVKRLEFIFITHFHRDHYGSLPVLLSHYPVGAVYMKGFSGLNIADSAGRPADQAYNDSELRKFDEFAEKAREVSEFHLIDYEVDQVCVGDFRFRVFGITNAIRELYEDPASPYYQKICFGENVNSTALFADVNGTTVYLGGDCGNSPLEVEKYSHQNDQYAKEVGVPIDLYKVPHHCCGNLFSAETLSILKPRYAVATNFRKSVENQFSGNRDLLLDSNPGITLLCTDLCGYRFTLGPDGDVSYEEIDPWPADKEKPAWMLED